MSNDVPDTVAQVLAAIRRQQDAIATEWAGRSSSDDREDAESLQHGTAAARIVGAVCDRLARDDGARPETRSNKAPAPADVPDSGPAEAGALSGLYAVFLEAAAAELDKVPAATIDDAFRVSMAIGEVLADVSAELTAPPPAGSSANGAERFEAFTRTVAHELKNPLGAARGAAEMLATGEGLESEEDRARFAQLVLRNVNRALELLDDVRADVRATEDVAAPPGAADAQ
jgi:signal transduction histidine kinase